MSSVYENFKEEAARDMLIMETGLMVEAVIQLLVSKGIISKVEIDYMKNELLKTPVYQLSYRAVQEKVKIAGLTEKYSEEYFRDFCAKLNRTEPKESRKTENSGQP